MKSYQIGNKVNCVIRTFVPSTVGEVETQYDNEPYTILKDVSVSLSFSDEEKTARDGQSFRQLHYDISTLNQVRISNVHLTNKVLDMLFNKKDVGLKTFYESVTSDEEGHIFITQPDETIYQVFIYNEQEEMVQAHGSVEPTAIVLNANENYLIVYQTLGTNILHLNSPVNTYFTLDLICEGNTDEVTAPTYIHIHKVGLRSEKSLYFNQNLNAVDLTFNVIRTDEDYIVLE